LRDFVRNHSARLDDPALLRFLERAAIGDVRVTFDPQAALASTIVEHLHNQHPLVKAIADFLKDRPDRIQPVCRLTLRTTTVPENDYAFYWAEVIEEGLQAGRSIWAEVAQHDGSGRLHRDVAERLVYELIVSGEAWPDFDSPPAGPAIGVMNMFESWIGGRCSERRSVAQEQNDARVNARLASLRASTEAKLRIVRDQLEQHRSRGNLRIIPAVEGRLRKIEADSAERQRQLESGRSVTVTYTAGGFGYVRVVAP
jgi:hypothetical protein